MQRGCCGKFRTAPMGEMEEKLGAILNDPQMMQQIMSMAQALGQSAPPPPSQPRQEEPPKSAPPQLIPSGAEAAMLQRLYGIARQSGIDKNQQALLKALTPYLARERIVKLEKAMRAAKIAGLASTVLGQSGIQFFSGR